MKYLIFTKRIFALSIIIVSIFAHASQSEAARLFFETKDTEVGVGQEMEITLHLDSEEETINALEGTIQLPDFLNVTTVRDGDSVVAFWSERPVINERSIIFSGLIPGGWQGSRSRIFSFIAKTKNQGSDTLTMSNTSVLLHDGKGAETTVKIEPLTLRVDESITPEPMMFDQEDDNELPEIFTPLLAQDPDILGGDYFLVFTAQDKGSSIDRYEVMESRKKLEDEQSPAPSGTGWQTIESPYRINDQTLKSFVYIRAIDRAGNIRVALIEPEKSTPSHALLVELMIFALVSIIIVFLIYIWRKSKGHFAFLIVIFSFAFLFLNLSIANAATLYFSSSSGLYEVGQQFNVRVLVSSTDKKMNAAGADISFSPKSLELVSISESNSLIDVWGEKPIFSNSTGRASFEGLMLDGYLGSAGRIVTLVFRAKSPGETTVRFSTGSVFAYDGLGTSILEGLDQANFTIISTTAPLQLFDISFRLESTSVAEASDLEAVVTFESFGRVPTPVELTYTIVNDQGQTAFKDTETIVVETENVVRKTFRNFDLFPGSYTLVLETLYNTDVADEFSADFTVIEKVEKESSFNNIRFWISAIMFLAIVIIILLLVIISLLLYRTQERRLISKEDGP